MTPRPTHICLWQTSARYSQGGVIVQDIACATCGHIRGTAVPVRPVQMPLIRKEEVK